MKPVKDAPCTRALAEQAEDRSGSRRRGDHELRRLDLLTDEELDGFRQRFGPEALDASDLLAEAIASRLEHVERQARAALEGRIPSRPILTVAVCLSCGTYAVARMTRPWAIDRAMLRTGLAERDVRAVLSVLAEAHGDHEPGRLDGLSSEQLRELRGLAGAEWRPCAARTPKSSWSARRSTSGSRTARRSGASSP